MNARIGYRFAFALIFGAVGCSAASTTPETSADGSEEGSGGSGGSDALGDGDGDLGEGSGGVAGDGDAPSTGGDTGTTPVEECATPSIDRYQQWLASGEGPTLPENGTLLEADDQGGYVAHANFTSASEWHVLVIWLKNEFEASVDLSGSSGFTLTYSATADFYIQLRPGFEWSGGAKWHMPIPSTGGQVETKTFSFNASDWEERLGTPPHSFEEALGDARGFVPVGNTINDISFYGLVVDGYQPPCL